jgi:RNA polymerase sigma-70 factor (ECF subfamily)
VIILREVEDYSYEEIAEILNIPIGTVRSRLFNARQFIKQRLIKQGLADEVSKVS